MGDRIHQRSSPTKELFLDILTKEEKEALLNKKMEEIKKKNEALKKRHEEIEADKQLAAAMKAKDPPPVEEDEQPRSVKDRLGSPAKEMRGLYAEEEAEHSKYSKGRGRQLKQMSEKSRMDGHDHNFRSSTENHRDGHDRREHRRENVLSSGDHSNRRDHGPHGDRRKDGAHGDRHDHAPRGRGGHVRGGKRRDDRRQHDGENWGYDYQQEHQGYDNQQDNRHDSPRGRGGHSYRRQDSGGRGGRGGRGPPPVTSPKSPNSEGPPPDPTFNFLSDRSRDPTAPQQDKDGSRRHPRNYGGQNFDEVKTKMQRERGKGKPRGPPRNKMEMQVSLTGRERAEYSNWKAERERIDLDRIQRQKDATGEWRREWDTHKDFFKNENIDDDRTEPARRPAGRIGSGRFDRGERGERMRGEAPGKKENVSPRGGRGGGRGGKSSPRNRTLSTGSDETSRKVEQQEDSLVIKIENDLTPRRGRGRDRRGGGGGRGARGGRGGRRGPRENRTSASHEEQAAASFANENWGESDVRASESVSSGDVESRSSEERGFHKEEYHLGDEYPHGDKHHHGDGDDGEWEDMPENEDFYEVEDNRHFDQDSVRSKEVEQINEGLKLQIGDIEPDTDNLEPLTPQSPESIKTPVGHVKVLDWGEAVDEFYHDNSPVSLEKTEEYQYVAPAEKQPQEGDKINEKTEAVKRSLTYETSESGDIKSEGVTDGTSTTGNTVSNNDADTAGVNMDESQHMESHALTEPEESQSTSDSQSREPQQSNVTDSMPSETTGKHVTETADNTVADTTTDVTAVESTDDSKDH